MGPLRFDTGVGSGRTHGRKFANYYVIKKDFCSSQENVASAERQRQRLRQLSDERWIVVGVKFACCWLRLERLRERSWVVREYGSVPESEKEGKAVSEHINNREYRKQVLKQIIRQLHEGKSVER